MSKLTEDQLDVLVHGLADHHATVDGWTFSYEYPGIFTFTKDNLIVCATPDYDTAGVIDLQVTTTDGRELGGIDIPYADGLTPAQYIALVRPYLLAPVRFN